MLDFEKMRFIESFAAALLGAYAYEKLGSDRVGSQAPLDAGRKFQRSLLLAAGNEGFTETVALTYKQRIANLHDGARLKYFKLTLQPSQQDCDERLTALMIFDHALQSSVEWELTVRMLSLDKPSVAERVSDEYSRREQAISQHAEKIREKQANEGWLSRKLRNLVG